MPDKLIPTIKNRYQNKESNQQTDNREFYEWLRNKDTPENYISKWIAEGFDKIWRILGKYNHILWFTT